MGFIMFNWLCRPKKETPEPNPYETMIAFGQVGQKVYASASWFKGTDDEIAENLSALFVYLIHGNSAQIILTAFEEICRAKGKLSLFESIKNKIGNKLADVETQLMEQENESIMYPSEAFGGNKINQPN